MNEEKDLVAELRELVGNGRAGAGHSYGAEIKSRVLAYAAERIAAGATLSQVAAAVGLNVHTLKHWRERTPDVPKPVVERGLMKPVRVVTGRGESAFILRAPGFQVEGLSLEDVVYLLGKLT
jgi:hypothetical protein